jgi:hypothetical protein
MITASQQARETLEILRVAVTEELQRKKRLGHYAVIWQDGKPVVIGAENDPALAQPSLEQDSR